ncbi:hypothetical protein [Psychroserpens sp. Hel_I_66]|uniref:hypothetical protein n=1 Tax=Psychroserpens sp. Hel_I_66 TaxID=1250004 RepID=UPI0006462F7F|nr:hypothetical protein [Psychroserpens sp. Hel_I_66]
MGEFLIEMLGDFIRDMIPSFLKGIGATIKWIFYGGKKTYSQIFEEEWNTRIGIFVVILSICSAIYL